MLPGLSASELGRIRMSVGYGTHKRGRPLLPIDVGMGLRKAISHGASVAECAEIIPLHQTGIARFLRILQLPEDLQHLVDWGSGKNFIGFSSAVEMVKLANAEDQHAVANEVLANGLSSKEVRQVAQLRCRSGRSIEACVREVLGMRPKIEKRYVFLGSVSPEDVDALRRLTQAARNVILSAGMEALGIRDAAGRLGARFFTLVGDERFNASMRAIGKENIEARIRSHISEAI